MVSAKGAKNFIAPSTPPVYIALSPP